MTPSRPLAPLARRRTRPAAALLAAALIGLAGCGGGGGEPPATPPPAATPAPAPAPAPAPSPAPAPAPPPIVSDFKWTLPAGWAEPPVPADNPMSLAKVELGRHLFFDVRLSGNEQFSCSTCHQRISGFGDSRVTPFGSTGQRLVRNSQPLANVAWFDLLTWSDPTATTLEQQMLTPLFIEAPKPVEMGVDEGNRAAVLARFAAEADYRARFAASFPGEADPLTWTNLIRAIAAFQRSIVSTDSRYDRALRGELTLTDAEQRGRDLFFSSRAGCSTCHGGNTFAEPNPAVVPAGTRHFNIGLYNIGGVGAYPAGNQGLIDRTRLPDDMGRFRTPSLRNVAVTGPYMNDGSVASLSTVLDIKMRGGRELLTGANAGDGAASPLRSPLAGPLPTITPSDKADLIAFLGTLTDPTFLNNPAYANPFATP